MTHTGWAESLARGLLKEQLPRRWAHTQGVAVAARSLTPVLGRDADLLIAAAWLHDIGYSPDVAVTGFHPLDGARYLRDVVHAEGMLYRLVAHHSGALTEAEERGFAADLSAEFAPGRPDLADALTYCDMTTSPDGQPLAVEQRLTDIWARYVPDHPVSRAITRSGPHLVNAVSRVTRRIAYATSADALAPCRGLTMTAAR